jgi:hypothetical protein
MNKSAKSGLPQAYLQYKMLKIPQKLRARRAD